MTVTSGRRLEVESQLYAPSLSQVKVMTTRPSCRRLILTSRLQGQVEGNYGPKSRDPQGRERGMRFLGRGAASPFQGQLEGLGKRCKLPQRSPMGELRPPNGFHAFKVFTVASLGSSALLIVPRKRRISSFLEFTGIIFNFSRQEL